MKRKRILCTFLASLAMLSSTALTACNLNDERKDVLFVTTESNSYTNVLLYKLKDYTVYYKAGTSKYFLKSLTVSLPAYYSCQDQRERITEENDNEYESTITLNLEHFTSAHISDLRINDSGYSNKYNSYLYADVNYELYEEKPLQIKDNGDTFIVTYYNVNFKNEEQTLYEWITYKEEFMKDSLQRIVYRAQ